MNKKNTIFMLRTMALIAVIISIVTFAPLNILIAWLTPLPTTVQAEVEKALTHGFDGIIVYVDAAGKPPAYFSAGWHNREQKIPAYPSALFKIASIEKLYDAVAITKLVAQNQLSLDNTLIDYFPELGERIAYANAITVKMLVQHRSGIPNFTDTYGFWDKPQLASNETALELIFDLPANFKPDAAFEYSNTNYLLLTKLIEKVTASSKYDYIHKHVLQPLSLNNTFGSMQDVDRTRLMSGYYVGVEQDIKNINYGSMLATAQDVGVFLRALNVVAH